MAEYSEPFDQGAPMFEEGWTDLWSTVQTPGIDPKTPNALEVYTDADGRQVKVRPGIAFIKGHKYRLDTTLVKPLAANTTGTFRTDYVVLRYDRAQKKITVEVLQGYDTGQVPNLATQPELFDVLLARLILPNNFATVAATGVITDYRVKAGALSATPIWYTPSYVNGYGSYDTVDASLQAPRYSKDGSGFVHLEGFLKVGSALSVNAFLLPSGFRPAKNHQFAVASNGALGIIAIAANGAVAPIVGAVWHSLSGISFYAG